MDDLFPDSKLTLDERTIFALAELVRREVAAVTAAAKSRPVPTPENTISAAELIDEFLRHQHPYLNFRSVARKLHSKLSDYCRERGLRCGHWGGIWFFPKEEALTVMLACRDELIDTSKRKPQLSTVVKFQR